MEPSAADRAFTELARDYLDDRAQRHPNLATDLGDHRFDALLPEYSAAAFESERRVQDRWAARLAAIDTAALSAEMQVDAGMLGNAIERRIFELDELRSHTWNPLEANPGQPVHALLARDFAPLPDRLAAVAGRLAQIPALLAGARSLLTAMPQVHLETAIGQFTGTISVVSDEIDAALADEALRSAPGCQAQIEAVRPAALAALSAHRDWLSARLEEGKSGGGFADPRLGAERFARKLSLTLDARADSAAILARAEADLDRVSEEIGQLAAELAGTGWAPSESPALTRQVLDQLAADTTDDTSILQFCRDALAGTTAFTREHDLITLYDDPVVVIARPQIDRGVAAAYCDSPGPLETAPVPTFVAVSPTPQGWPADRVASFYREYNRHMIHNLMVHEAMPGHFAQLQHSRRFRGGAAELRAALRSGSFVEGWAVHAEEVMAVAGYPGEGDPRAVRMQRLKMELRMIINAILDAKVHGQGMTEAQAMALMTDRGHQEEGEAVGKWRRALLTSAQLSTYYVGYTEISDLAGELTAAHPGLSQREIHDRMLAHGSPPVRRLRTLLVGPER
jgi:uncharacterized protein (DUF885 family)